MVHKEIHFMEEDEEDKEDEDEEEEEERSDLSSGSGPLKGNFFN